MRVAIAKVAVVAPAGQADGAVVELRREAVAAVVHQQRLREELAEVRPRAAWTERKAWLALERGDERLARQVLDRGIQALITRDALEMELGKARRRLVEVLTALVRAENRAWGTETHSSPGRARGGSTGQRGAAVSATRKWGADRV